MTSRQTFARTRPLTLAAQVAAFFAVALLSLAAVKSTVMQAQDAMPWNLASICQAQMPGMGDKGGSDAAHKTTMASCAFCAAAAHAPLQSVAEPVFAPISVAWIAPPPVSDHSARGPPTVQPKARGPPASLQTV